MGGGGEEREVVTNIWDLEEKIAPLRGATCPDTQGSHMRKQPKISRMGKPTEGKPQQISLHSASEVKVQEPRWNPP